MKTLFRLQPENKSVYAGESVVLKCSPPRGQPVPTVSWLQDGGLVSNSSRRFISSKGNLTISPVTKADQGSYMCRANSPLGTEDSQEALLTVKGMAQSRSQSPCYPYPVAGMGNKDLCDKAFRQDSWTSGFTAHVRRNALSQRSLLPVPATGYK